MRWGLYCTFPRSACLTLGRREAPARTKEPGTGKDPHRRLKYRLNSEIGTEIPLRVPVRQRTCVRNGPAVWQEQGDPTHTKQSEFQQAAAGRPALPTGAGSAFCWRSHGAVGPGMPGPSPATRHKPCPGPRWSASRQRHLRAVAFGDVPQPATVARLEAQFVLFVHQTVPVRPFVRSDGPHDHVAQGPNGQAVERGSGRIGRPSL